MYTTYLVNGMDVRAQAPVDTEHPSIDYRRQRQVVEHFATVPPHIRTAVLPLTFVVETVDLGNLSRFVVTADKSDAVWVSDFEG